MIVPQIDLKEEGDLIVKADEFFRRKLKSVTFDITFDGLTIDHRKMIGVLGELAVCRYLKRDIDQYLRWKSTLDDVGTDMILRHLQIDVKTRTCSAAPKANFPVFVAEWQFKNQCNSYAFVAVSRSFKAYLLGWATKDWFMKHATYRPKGTEVGVRRHKLKSADRYMESQLLRPISELLDLKDKGIVPKWERG